MSNVNNPNFNKRFRMTDVSKLDPNRPRTVGIYARVSTQHEAQIHALKNQIQWYQEELKKHPNWTVYEYYIDEGITGTQAKKRPNFLRMIEDAQAGKIDLIVTREVSRFSRNKAEALKYAQELETIGVEIYFIAQEIWTFTEHGKQGLYFLSYFAEKESQSTSQRVKAGQAISRENKSLYGNGNILGYELIKREDQSNTYAIIPDEAETVRMIFDLYLQNHGFGKIAKMLTERKRKNASGEVKWSQQTVRRVIQNATYAGLIGYNKSRSNGFLTQKRVNNLDMSTFEYVQGDFEPIVTLAQWERAQEIRESKTTRSSDPENPQIVGKQVSTDIWVQKMRCPCGCGFRRNKWYTYKDGSHSYAYQCYNQLNNGSKKQREALELDTEGFCDVPMTPAWKMDCMAQEVMQQVWTNKNESLQIAIDLIRKHYKDNSDTTQKNTKSIQTKIERLKKRISGFVEMRADGDLSKEEYTQKRSEAEAEIASLEAELAVSPEDTQAERDAKLDSIIDTLKALADTEDGKVDRNVIDHFVSKVMPMGNDTYEWYLDLNAKSKAKASMTVKGRKNKEVIKLEEIMPISSGLTSFMPYQILPFKNSHQSTTPHRLPSRTAGTKKLPEVRNIQCDLRGRKRVRLLLKQETQSPQMARHSGKPVYLNNDPRLLGAGDFL